MKARHLFGYAIAALVALPLIGTVSSAATIEVIETFDFPGVGRLTQPQKINDNGDIVGTVIDAATGESRGFYRGRGGRFSGGFIEPNDTGMLTQARAINNARVICGVYGNGSDGSSHGYFLAHHIFTEYDAPGVVDTFLLGINDAGDFAGSISDPTFQDGFVSVGGTITAFSVPGASATIANNLNASNQTQGFYVDAADDTVHGFLRDGDGTLTFPIDPAGAVETVLFGNNDANWIVGRYTDASGITHGLFFITPGEYVTFDFPGSAFTSLNGINQQGYICGRYVDAAGGQHGFLAKVNPNGISEPNNNNALPVTPIKPLRSFPARAGIGAPAF